MTGDEFLTKLRKATDQEIETNLAANSYSADHRPLAELELERRCLARCEAARADKSEIAHNAKDAAWKSTKVAAAANRRAIIAIDLSILSTIVSVTALVVAALI